MINETQYRKLIEVFNKSGEILMSSLKAAMDRKTGAKYFYGHKTRLDLLNYFEIIFNI